MNPSKLIKTFLLGLIGLAIVILLSNCRGQSNPDTIKVGTISGPETELMEVAKNNAKQRFNLNIEIVPFADYTMPNRALSEGDIDANMFQTIAYYDADTKAHGYKFAIVGKTFIYPMAIYSKKIKSLAEIPNNAVVAIPNDPSNEARALKLLEKAGLIKVNAPQNDLISVLDITSNPKNLQIKTLDAAQLPRVLPDVTLAAINTNYAVPAGLYPLRDGLFSEDKHSPYANVIVVQEANKNNEKILQLVEALQSPEVAVAAKKLFADQAIPAWEP